VSSALINAFSDTFLEHKEFRQKSGEGLEIFTMNVRWIDLVVLSIPSYNLQPLVSEPYLARGSPVAELPVYYIWKSYLFA
jgi:hypothetical protein